METTRKKRNVSIFQKVIGISAFSVWIGVFFLSANAMEKVVDVATVHTENTLTETTIINEEFSVAGLGMEEVTKLKEEIAAIPYSPEEVSNSMATSSTVMVNNGVTDTFLSFINSVVFLFLVLIMVTSFSWGVAFLIFRLIKKEQIERVDN